MEKNILFLLTPKNDLALLDDSMSIRQALEKMRSHGYTAVPVINKQTGEYVGSISEGDLLWHIVEQNKYDINDLEKKNIKQLIRSNYRNAVKVDASIDEVLKIIVTQNYVPVVDDRNVLMGIVTRRKLINEMIYNQEQ